ncbi:MAG TPA: iron ABC transporter permease [Dongiaceae bacterium]|jgi:iron complex transport system permease protein|nr:iron ABC transporter permease [Dongiaceae bacterium]
MRAAVALSVSAFGGARRRGWPVIAALTVLLVFSVIYSVTLGRYGVSMTHAWLILWSHVVPVADPTWTAVDANVVEAIRLPRILAALLVGAGLAISGAALQGLFRNPLVDPGIIGVTAGAGFGGTLAILLVGGGTLVMGAAFGFGIGSLLVVRLLASVKGRTSTLTFVLAGVIVSAFFEAAISIVKLLADPHQKLPAITYWLMGSIAATGYDDLALLALAILPPSLLIFLLRYQINILSLGEEKARALGSPIERVQWMIYAAVACISAGIVATSGIVGWVGLVIPHVARALVGPDHARLLPVAALLGAVYLLLVDDIARTATVAELPIGIITALIGVPVFALILRRVQSKSGWAHD